MEEIKEAKDENINEVLQSGAGPKITRFIIACLGGLPVIGGAFGAGAGAWSEAEQSRFNKIFASWLKLQEDEIKEIGRTLMEVMMRVDQADEKVRSALKVKNTSN